MQPTESEEICLTSYEITCILLGGSPAVRPGFWKAYRRELALNRKTNYENYHVRLCRELLSSPPHALRKPVYYRNDRLTIEKEITFLPALEHSPHP